MGKKIEGEKGVPAQDFRRGRVELANLVVLIAGRTWGDQ